MHKDLVNTLIFAIRHWQRTGHTGDYPELEDGNPDIVDDDELDAVCEGLNCGTITLHERSGDVRHWIVSGRRHGDDEACAAHVGTRGDGDPCLIFARDILFANVDDDNLPAEFFNEEADGELRGFYIDSCFEIPGPPLSEK